MAEECVALCDYVGADGELSFRKGEIVTVLAKGTDSGFWEGCATGSSRRGLFPNSMVTSNLNVPRCAKIFLNKAVALFDYTARSAAEMSFAKHDLITAIRPAPNAGWWFGVNETQRRAARAAEAAAGSPPAPRNAVSLGSTYFDAEPGKADNADAERWVRLLPTNFVTCNVVVAAYPFQGRQRHELSLSVGDVVMVHRRWNDGWWEGSLPADASAPLSLCGAAPIVVGGRRRGIFPSNYTIPNVPTTQPPLFCAKCRAVLPTGALSGECRDCNRNDEIMRTMMRTLQEHVDEFGPGGPPCDLFAHIDLDPKKGPGALLSAADVKDQTVRPRSTV